MTCDEYEDHNIIPTRYSLVIIYNNTLTHMPLIVAILLNLKVEKSKE